MSECSNDTPPSIPELLDKLTRVSEALSELPEVLVTAPNALAVMIDQGALIARTAEARRDLRRPAVRS